MQEPGVDIARLETVPGQQRPDRDFRGREQYVGELPREHRMEAVIGEVEAEIARRVRDQETERIDDLEPVSRARLQNRRTRAVAEDQGREQASFVADGAQ